MSESGPAVPPADCAHLVRLFEAAEQVKDQITWAREGYPRYPPEIEAFFDFIGRASWTDRNYPGKPIREWIGRIDSVTPEELATILTAMMRAERFSLGAWQGIFQDGDARIVAERARQLARDADSP